MENIKGQEALLSLYVGSAYKPIVCLTETSTNRVSEIIQKVNYCTRGVPTSKVDSVSTTVNISGEIVKLEEETDKATYKDLITAIESKEEQTFKYETIDSTTPEYFKAVIAKLDGTFGEGDATFSGSLTVNGGMLAEDPNAAPDPAP